LERLLIGHFRFKFNSEKTFEEFQFSLGVRTSVGIENDLKTNRVEDKFEFDSIYIYIYIYGMLQSATIIRSSAILYPAIV